MSPPVCTISELPPGTLLRIELADGTPVCLGNHAGRVFALHDRCTHADFSLSAGELMADGRVQCLWHGATFDAVTGAVCRGPATDPVATFGVRVVDGDVFVDPRAG